MGKSGREQNADVMVAFLGYAPGVLAEQGFRFRKGGGHRAQADLSPIRCGERRAFSPTKAWALLSTLQSADIVLSTPLADGGHRAPGVDDGSHSPPGGA